MNALVKDINRKYTDIQFFLGEGEDIYFLTDHWLVAKKKTYRGWDIQIDLDSPDFSDFEKEIIEQFLPISASPANLNDLYGVEYVATGLLWSYLNLAISSSEKSLRDMFTMKYIDQYVKRQSEEEYCNLIYRGNNLLEKDMLELLETAKFHDPKKREPGIYFCYHGENPTIDAEHVSLILSKTPAYEKYLKVFSINEESLVELVSRDDGSMHFYMSYQSIIGTKSICECTPAMVEVLNRKIREFYPDKVTKSPTLSLRL